MRFRPALARVIAAAVLGTVQGAFVPLAFAQEIEQSEIRARPIRGNLLVLLGYGSNIVVSIGRDGSLLVDDEYAVLTDKVRAKLKELQAPRVKRVINTHWHNDHTGGNESFAGEGAIIIAQENSAQRMHTDQRMSLYGPQAAYPPAAWPKIEVKESLKLHWNKDDIELIHVGPAHTDGDLVVYFRKQNVLATGDVFVRDEYLPPYFDDLNGGSAAGMIAAADRLLGLVDDNTIIVPGHGSLTDRKGLQEYRDHFVAVRDHIRDAISRGLSEDAVVALHPAEGFAKAGRGTDRWVRILYREK
jgi:glyoxylase-like metal-dependent hydrolase (beta-lactamase superfamily II)